MTDTNVSNDTANTEGVQASSDNNDWKAIAQSKQSIADKYEAMQRKYGENFEQDLQGFSEFKESWTSDPKRTIEYLQEQAGIKVNESPQQPSQPSQEELNVWELGDKNSKAYQWFKNEASTISKQTAKEIASEAINGYKQEQQLNQWRQQLAQNGITDYKQQNEAIREFLNPNPDFNQFLKSKVSPKQESTPRPSEVLQQVSSNQAQPKSSGVLQGNPPQGKTWAQERVDAVMDIAKKKAGTDTF